MEVDGDVHNGRTFLQPLQRVFDVVPETHGPPAQAAVLPRRRESQGSRFLAHGALEGGQGAEAGALDVIHSLVHDALRLAVLLRRRRLKVAVSGRRIGSAAAAASVAVTALDVPGAGTLAGDAAA